MGKKASSKDDRENAIREEVDKFLSREFPQIRMHGGESQVGTVDLDENEVEVHLGGACDGCGLSNMTIQAIKKRLPKDVDGVDRVYVSIYNGDTRTRTKRDSTDAPF